MKKRKCILLCASFILLCILFFAFFEAKQNKFNSINYFIESGNLEKAELILKHCSKKEKNTFDYNYLNGIVLTKKSIAGYKRDALNSFLKANEYDSNNYQNNLMISKIYIEVNDLDNAERFALKAREFIPETDVVTIDDDVHYLLAKIYFMKRNYESAYENIKASNFQDDKNVAFLQTEIADLKNETFLLDSLFQEYNDKKLLTDELQLEYMNYLFLNTRIKDADILADSFLENDSLYLKYYGCLFKAYISMLNNNLEYAENYIEKSYDYTVSDSLFLRYKMKFFYAFLTEKDPIRVFNSFIMYIWLYEKDDKLTITAKEDLTEVYEYFKDDMYFNLLLEKYKNIS